MSLSNAAEAALLDLLFLNIDFANIGDAAGLQNSAVAGSYYLALHTADPGEAGTQATSECTYTGYARVAVARTAGGFSRVTDTVSNVAAVTFGQCTAGVETATWFTIGLQSAGATVYLLRGALSSSLLIQSPVQPVFAPGTMTAQVN